MQTPHNRLSIKINNKTKTELIWAEIFRRYVNDRFACDYQEVVGKTFQIPKDYPDIDVVLVSPSGRENLFLQLRRDLGKFEIIDIDGKNTPLSYAGWIKKRHLIPHKLILASRAKSLDSRSGGAGVSYYNKS